MSRDATVRILVMLAAVPASLALAAQNRPAIELGAYYKLVKDYRQGRAEAAIDALVTLPPGATKAVISSPDPHWSSDDLSAAALLETEAGFRSSSLSMLSARLSNADLWLVRARKWLVNERLDTRRQDDFRRTWAVVVGRKALWLTIVGLVDPMLKEACDMFPKDADLHLAFGLARETAAFSVDHLAMADVGRIGLESALLSPSLARAGALMQAREAFERAVELSPGSAEARVRLAHVYVRLKDDRRAVPHLEHARTTESLPAYRYIASLLLGDVRKRAGDIEAAIELYLSARQLMPNAQSAYIAQANALRTAGRAEEATAVIGEMLGRATHEDDPWVFYPRGFEFALTQFGPLRALVLEK
jgi:tetratricopeptide (TPR) repeat protein